uniref:Putative secreted protein n=1 Tax=Ixodes ricinus TaxID=34613 RepID=A0A6B0U9J4_IXORI
MSFSSILLFSSANPTAAAKFVAQVAKRRGGGSKLCAFQYHVFYSLVRPFAFGSITIQFLILCTICPSPQYCRFCLERQRTPS